MTMNLANIPQIHQHYGGVPAASHYVTHHVHSPSDPMINTATSTRQQLQPQTPGQAQSISSSTAAATQRVTAEAVRSQQATSQAQAVVAAAAAAGTLTSRQAFGAWPGYPTSLGTGITDTVQRGNYAATSTTTATHSTPNSYTAEFYGDEHPQSLGFGAMSVTSSILNQPHTLQAASTIQSALNHLNASQPGQLNRSSNKENRDQNKLIEDQPKTITVEVPKVENPGNSSSFYLAPGSANHGGSYRQTLNPAIYNAYRLNSSSSQQTSTPIPTTSSLINRNNPNKPQPVVHVIAETVYRVPNSNKGGALFNGRGSKQDRFDKTALYKTELCTNWMLTGACTYGNKCHFAHGVEDLKPRMRVENYKTQPCCDPAREGCKKCMYGRRCNYCHPGEAIRRPHPTPYYDKDYYHALMRDFGQDNQYPFGIYV